MVATSNPMRRPFDGQGRLSPLRHTLTVALLFLALNLRSALQFDVFVGLDNYVPEASWFPIVCEVDNDGASFQAVIEVTGEGVNQSGFTRLVPVELPTGTRKRITIPVFGSSSYGGKWDVRLKDAQGRTRAEQTGLPPISRAPVKRGTVLLGSLARVPSWVPAFQKILPNQIEWQPAAARLNPLVFPDNALVLEGMDALYLNSERAADLRAQQIAAIESWINSGGHLIVAVEQVSDVNTLPWLRRLVPMELTGTRQIQPGTALEDWLRSPVATTITQKATGRSNTPRNQQTKTNLTFETPFADAVNDNKFAAAQLAVATGTMRGGQVIVTAGGTPLIVSALHGNGRVSVVLFSPEREPAKAWRNQPTFWARLTGVPARWYVSNENAYGSGMGTDGIFGAMIDSRQVRKLPIWQLLLMLLVYLAIIGPVDQFWLKKIGKPMLTWITFPCYVALFSGLIYLVGYKLRAGESEWNELHVVDVFQSGDKTELRGHTYGSIYSPVNQRYNFESTARSAAFRGEFAGSWSTDRSNDRGRVVQTENSFKAEVFVPVWTSQLYVNDWLQPAEAPFFTTIEKDGSGWIAKVQNRQNKPLTNVRLVVKGKLYELGEVPANQTRQFTQTTATSSSSLTDFVNRIAGSFEGVVQQRRSAFGGRESGRIENLADASAATSFLAHRQNGNNNYYSFLQMPAFDLSGVAEQDNAVLLAWSAGQAPVKSLNQFTPRRSTANTLWRMTLPLAPSP